MSDSTPAIKSSLASFRILRRTIPLIPREAVAGRSLVTVIAIMTYLACLTAGAALLVSRASANWRTDVLKDVTIQVRTRAGDDIESVLSKVVGIASSVPGVGDVHSYSENQSQSLLKPWLGDGLDLGLLPVPRIVVGRLRDQRMEIFSALRGALSVIPQASVDDHQLWALRVGVMADAIVAVAASLFALMIIAIATAIGFATRGAVAGNREIVEVLHLVGASDSFIASEFEKHFRQLGLEGAFAGVICATLFFIGASVFSSWWSSTLGGNEIASIFGAFALGYMGWGALLVIGVSIAILTGYLSRVIVLRHLNHLQ